jgi:hypothetical protein
MEDHATNNPFLCFCSGVCETVRQAQIPGANPVANRYRLRGSDFWPISADRPLLGIMRCSWKDSRTVSRQERQNTTIEDGDDFGASSFAHDEHCYSQESLEVFLTL